jgi:hypothetical protein
MDPDAWAPDLQLRWLVRQGFNGVSEVTEDKG